MAVTQNIKRMVRVSGRKKNPHNIEQARIAKEKAYGALELRKAGVSYAKIATAIGYSSASNCKRGIDRLILHEEKDASMDVIMLDLQRMDEYIQRCTNALRQNGDLSQIDRLLRICEAKYRLLGISDENMSAVRESYGVSTKIDNSTSVMIVQASQTSEAEFIKRMMQAVNIDPTENKDAAEYMEARKVLEIESPKKHAQKKAGGSAKGVIGGVIGGVTGGSRKVVRIKRRGGSKKVTEAHVLTEPPHTVLIEDDIIDAEIL